MKPSRIQTAAAATLPPEILSYVLSLVMPLSADLSFDMLHLHSDKDRISRYRKYAACARICKSWHKAAMPFLYYRIELDSLKRTELFYETIAKHNPSYANYVQEFSGCRIYDYEDTAPASLAGLLESLPTTKRLYLPSPFIPSLHYLLLSKAGRDEVGISGRLESGARRNLDDHVLSALPSELSKLCLRDFSRSRVFRR